MDPGTYPNLNAGIVLASMGIMATQAFNVPRHHEILFRENVAKDPVPQDKGFTAEVFHRLYSESPNEVEASEGNACRKRLHGLIDELPEFDTLRHLTTRDPMWAGMASATLGEKVAPCVPKSADVAKAEDILAGLEMMQAEYPESPKVASEVAKGQKAVNDAIQHDKANAELVDESAVRHALRAAIGQATQDIQDAESALSLLGYGQGGGTTSTYTNPSVALELARRVKSSPTLAAVIALAGKLTRTARAKRAARSEYARSEVVGVEQTNDVSRLLGSEMALLNDPDMSDDLLIRLTEKRALGFKMHGKDKLAKGPIVLMLDQSGSMCENNKDVWAKAIALAIYDAARQDKRDFAIVLYDTGVIMRSVISNPADMLAAIESGPRGGTDYESAMVTALDLAKDKSDIVHITDGSAPTHNAAALLAKADSKHTRVFGIGIGECGSALQAWSHEVTKIQDVNRDTAAMDLIFGEGGI